MYHFEGPKNWNTEERKEPPFRSPDIPKNLPVWESVEAVNDENFEPAYEASSVVSGKKQQAEKAERVKVLLGRLETVVKQIDQQVAEGKMDIEKADELVAMLGKRIYQAEREIANFRVNVVYESNVSEAAEGSFGNESQKVTSTDDTDLQIAEQQIIKDILSRGPVAQNTEQLPYTKERYLEAKKAFKEAKQKYFNALQLDYNSRNPIKKLFGLGRDESSLAVQEAYSAFKKANESYYEMGLMSGIYHTDIDQHLSKQGKKEYLTTLVADRHVFGPAEQRLELQTLQLPEGLQKLKQRLTKQIEDHPMAVGAVGGFLGFGGLLVNAPVTIAGFATAYLGYKSKLAQEEELRIQQTDIIDSFERYWPEVSELEREYFNSLDEHIKGVLTGAALRNRISMTGKGNQGNPESVFGKPSTAVEDMDVDAAMNNPHKVEDRDSLWDDWTD